MLGWSGRAALKAATLAILRIMCPVASPVSAAPAWRMGQLATTFVTVG